MLKRTFWSFVLIFTIYVIGVFLSPVLFDDLGSLLGIYGFNEKLREFKAYVSQEVYEPKIKQATEVVQGSIDNVSNSIEKTKEVVDTKKKQLNKTIDTVNKLKNTYNELEQNVGDLTTVSGATN